jgi:RHS repeat-associated protein
VANVNVTLSGSAFFVFWKPGSFGSRHEIDRGRLEMRALGPWVALLLLSVGGWIPAVYAATTLTYEYDANGNLVKGEGKAYEYNDANQLVRVRHGDAAGPVIAEYLYDHTGQRIKKIEDGVTTYYIGKHYETRVEGGLAASTSYYFADGERIAKKDATGKIYYYVNDHLGGTNAVVDSNGKLIERTRYFPFGEIRDGGNERYTYTGKEKDKASDLYYYEARHYKYDLNHFTQADIIISDIYDPQNLNRYSYVKNNPSNYIDPSGYAWWNPLTWFKGKSYTKEKTINNYKSGNLAKIELPEASTSPIMNSNSIDFTNSFRQGHPFKPEDGINNLGGQCGWFTQQLTDVYDKYGPMGNTLSSKQELINKNIGNGAFLPGSQEIKPGYVIFTNESDSGHAAIVNSVEGDFLTLTETNFNYTLGVDHTRKLRTDSNLIIGILIASPK